MVLHAEKLKGRREGKVQMDGVGVMVGMCLDRVKAHVVEGTAGGG